MIDENDDGIKIILAEKNLPYRYLAEKLCRDQATTSMWVTNNAQPPIETLIQIAQCLDVNVQELNSVSEHNPFQDSHVTTD